MIATEVDPDILARRLKAEALRLGFDRVGIAPAVAPPDYPRFLDWLARGDAAGMGYLHRQADARAHPSAILPGVRSVVLVLMVYGDGPDALTHQDVAGTSHFSQIARYAQGEDYHEVLWRRLESLLDWLKAEAPGATGRAVVDTAPLLERDYARLAGLGWVGKNTTLIDRKLGSFTVLGALLTDAELTHDAPMTAGHCGSCTRCLDACPTDAFDGPYRLDARKCISYWNIEHRGPVPGPEAPPLHGWAFGCDVCQDVCPWNRKAPGATEPRLRPRDDLRRADLLDWLELDDAAFRERFRGTALKRAKRSGLVRNAARIVGERRLGAAVPALIRRLEDDDPTIRWASAEALGRIGGDPAREALRDRLGREEAPEVAEAIRRSLADS